MSENGSMTDGKNGRRHPERAHQVEGSYGRNGVASLHSSSWRSGIRTRLPAPRTTTTSTIRRRKWRPT